MNWPSQGTKKVMEQRAVANAMRKTIPGQRAAKSGPRLVHDNHLFVDYHEVERSIAKGGVAGSDKSACQQ